MTMTRNANSTSRLHDGLVRVLQRWGSALAEATPRGRRPRRRIMFAHPPPPPLDVWGLDESELASALEHSRW